MTCSSTALACSAWSPIRPRHAPRSDGPCWSHARRRRSSATSTPSSSRRHAARASRSSASRASPCSAPSPPICFAPRRSSPPRRACRRGKVGDGDLRGAEPEGVSAELLAIDERLRNDHADALGDLLQLGPRTRLDATALATWIAAAEASARQAGGTWAATALALAELDVDFPVAENALGAIFANLLRNAQQAVAGQPDARVLVRVDRARDVTGRASVTLFVGDSAAAPLTMEAIEARESGRGLAIVRDLVRAWRGHMVVRPESAPFTKLVGASFPL